MSEEFCNCEEWKKYVRNYSEVFHYNEELGQWYILWTHLSDQGGYTQVSRYAIPIMSCPLCGFKLKSIGED